MTERTCERKFAKFREGDSSLQDLLRTGLPQILDLQSLKASVDADSGVTIRESAIEFGCCQQTIINAFASQYAVHQHSTSPKMGRWLFLQVQSVIWNKDPKPTRKMQELNSFTGRILNRFDMFYVLFFNKKIKIKLKKPT